MEVNEQDVYEIDGSLDLTMFFHFYDIAKMKYSHLIYEPLIPQQPGDITPEDDLFEEISKRDILLHHPYESFRPVIEFIAKQPLTRMS